MYKNKNTNDSSYFLDNIIYSGSKISEIKPKDSISEDASTNTPPSSPDSYYDYYCNPALTKAIDKLCTTLSYTQNSLCMYRSIMSLFEK